MRRILRMLSGGGVVLLLVIQLVPYGRGRTNPPVSREPAWDSPLTRELARRACFDCHSNESRWPWYSRVAPVSWLVFRDVSEGRAKLNFSEWDRPQEEAGEASEALLEGEMPPWFYLPLHPEARLSSGEKEALAAGLARTLAEPGGDRKGDRD